jgi:hypothetical protein
MTRYRSRPRAMCVDLIRTLLTEYHVLPDVGRLKRGRDAFDGFHLSRRGAEIWQAAHDAGLPTAVITDLPKAQVRIAIQALPSDPDLLLVSENTDQDDGRSALLEKAAEALNITAGDILFVGDAECTDIAAPKFFGMRTCGGNDAVEQLQLLDIHPRRALLSDRKGDDAELAHAVLLPLDLNIYDMDDSELFRRRCHFVFDTVLIIEGLVPTSGFGLKGIEKNVAGHAILLYGIRDFDQLPDVKKIVRERLHRIKDGGAKRVILVHTENPETVDQHNIAATAESLGYAVELQTWKTLMSQFEQDPICEI